MALPIPHPQANMRFVAGQGDEDRVGSIDCLVKFYPGSERVASVTSAWRFTPEEIEEINRTGIVMMNSLYGLPAHFIASESEMRKFLIDAGA